MRIVVTGGGTAGHVTPLLAVASELRNRDGTVEIRYIGQRKDPMVQLVAESTDVDKQYHIFAGKWRRYPGLTFIQKLGHIGTFIKNVRDIFYLAFGFVQSLVILTIWRPQVVFVKGGFVGLPVGIAAAVLRIPLVTHDSDALPGVTNRIISRFAVKNAVALSADKYVNFYPKNKIIQTGVPVRLEYMSMNNETRLQARNTLRIPHDHEVITVIGGSLGAVGLNEIIKNALSNLFKKNGELFVLWVCGPKQYDELARFCAKQDFKKQVRLYSFTNDLYKLVDAASVVVSRAGATSIAELSAASKPTILVPSKYLAGNHQVINAKLLEQQGAVLYIDEASSIENPESFCDDVLGLLGDKSRSNKLANTLHSLHIPDSSHRIAKLLIETGKAGR
jgi:UDP-N-acetylglucosamine--N-acetylmuramyl-(pentapeptide) pyrophosphoryl-undecaprenol N-acetylglucosamine transferase